MGRIRDAYAAKFRTLLGRVRPRRIELGVLLLLERADRLSHRDGIALPQALARVYERAQQQIERRKATASASGAAASPAVLRDVPVFLCDAGLGGLARWLRAAGYASHWVPHIDDDELLREARRKAATLLTTDSLLMRRGVLRDGLIPALWVPPTMKKLDQLVFVLRELCLPRLDPRCMSCGGKLRRVDKESVRERIPPKTYRWRDEYFVCDDCGKLYWHGTHWADIAERLRKTGSERGRSDGRPM
jgi:uncharacterized protein with PIN domain